MKTMSKDEALYTVGEVAQTLEITVRMLHHWESQGLIEPSERSWSNYRLYTPADVDRIQQILIYRATGMKLVEIKDLLVSGASNLDHLQRQRKSLIEQQSQLSEMVKAIDLLIGKEMENEKLSLDQIGDILGDANFSAHQAEAEKRYGDTDDWAISKQRTSNWGTADWAAHKQRFEQIDARLAAAVKNGISPDGAEATQLVEEHRSVLSEFFPVTPAKHYLISLSYVCDERFRRHYEAKQEGLAQWLADAIAKVAKDYGVDLENPDWA